MKKTLAIIIVAVMLLSTLVALVVPAAAAGEGNWDVMLSANAQPDDPKNPPLAGYHYDATGFHTDAPNYKDYNPKFSIVSKEMYNIQNFSMTIVVHDYSIAGDNWLSFTIWSDCNGFAQGDTSGKYGDGWTSLIRPGADGNVNRFESWNQTKGGRSNKQTFTNIDGTQLAPVVFEPIVDAETGDFTVTFKIENGVVSVNGSVIGAGTDSCIADRFKDGLAYVGVTVHNTDASGAHSPSISITDVNGMTPEGTDSRAAEVKDRKFGDLIPSDSVPANTPSVWFDGTLEGTNTKLPTGSNCDIDFADDNESLKITAGAAAFYMQFEVPDPITYEASDFTYIVFIFKNFCTCAVGEGESLNDECTGGEVGSIWSCAGEVTSPRNDCAAPIPAYYLVTPTDDNGDWAYEDMYTVGVLQVTNELWSGRIHGIRMDVGQFANYGIDGKNTFEIMGAGAFKSGADVVGFVSEFRDLGLDTEWLAMDLDETCDHFDWDEDGLCDLCFEDMSAEVPTTEVPTETPTENNGSDEPATTVPGGDNTAEVPSENGSETPSEDASANVPSEGETGEAGEAEVTTDKKDEATTAKKDEATTKADSSDDEGEAKKGCKSSVAMGALAIVAIVGTGLVAKKKED